MSHQTMPHKILPTLPFCYFQCLKFILNRIDTVYLDIDLDGKSNYSSNAHFRFSNYVHEIQKLKKEKWQCSQNFDLNPTYEIMRRGDRDILVERFFVYKRFYILQWTKIIR